MLKKETAEMLGKVLPKGITVQALTEALTSEKEVELQIPEGRFLDTTSEETLLDNHGKNRYDAGKLAGTEITLKEIKKAGNLDIQSLDKDEIVDAFKKKIVADANVEPAKKVTDLEDSLRILQKKYEEDIKQKDSLITQKDLALNALNTATKLQSVAPKFKEGINFNDAYTLFNANHEVKEDGIYKNGQLLKSDLQKPLTQEEAFLSFVNEKGWSAKKPQGNGGGNGNPITKPTSYDEFKKVCESKGWSEGSQDARAYLKTLKSENPEFQH